MNKILNQLGFLKKKIVIIPLIVATTLFLGLLMLKFALEDEDWDKEIDTKFPLEDYLFQNSKSKKEQEEFQKMQEELEKMRQQLLEQEKQLSQAQQELEQLGIYDEKGRQIEFDENGNPILYDKDGNRIYFDENGNPYILDKDGKRKYLDKDEVPKMYDENGNEVYFDKDGNKITITKDGFKIVQDKNGNFKVYDKDGKLVAKGNINNKKDLENLLGLLDSDRPDGFNPFAADKDKSKKDKDKNKNADTDELAGEEAQEKERDPNLLYDENGNVIGDRVAKENQKFFYHKAGSDKQRIINDILATRFDDDEVKSTFQTEYGVDSFTNLSDKDEGSNEHKLLRTITADRMIPAFLVRPISSQIDGEVVAQVESDIYGAMGRAILIPKGSRVIGFYQNNNKIGEYRLKVYWTRIITPTGVNILLTDAQGADIKGYNGLIGKVYSRNFQRYGIPITLSTLSNGLLLYVNSLSSQAESSSSDTTQLTSAYVKAQMLSNMRSDLSTIISKITAEQMKIQPIIVIREGSRIFIAPTRDIFIPIPKNNEAMARFFTEQKEVKEYPNKKVYTTEGVEEEDNPLNEASIQEAKTN